MSTKEIDRQVLSFDEEQNGQINSELVTKEEIKDSPFTVIGTDEGFFGCIGRYRITEPVEDKKALIKDLKKITWNRLTQVMLILIEVQNK